MIWVVYFALVVGLPALAGAIWLWDLHLDRKRTEEFNARLDKILLEE